MNIDWTQQPGPEYMALVRLNTIDVYWVKRCEHGYTTDSSQYFHDLDEHNYTVHRRKDASNVVWADQPGPEYVALVLDGRDEIIWCIKDPDGYWNGTTMYTGRCATIHHKPEPAVYMPEVGECEYQLEEGSWEKCFFIGKSKDGRFVYEIRHCLLVRSDLVKFRPIKTERELFIEQAKTIFRGENRSAHTIVAGVLYDNGARFSEVVE